MNKYILDGSEYYANSDEEFLAKVKNENSHTMGLSLDSYINEVAAAMINTYYLHKVKTPARASDIVKAWKENGLLT